MCKVLSDWQRLQCCEPCSPSKNEPLKKSPRLYLRPAVRLKHKLNAPSNIMAFQQAVLVDPLGPEKTQCQHPFHCSWWEIMEAGIIWQQALTLSWRKMEWQRKKWRGKAFLVVQLPYRCSKPNCTEILHTVWSFLASWKAGFEGVCSFYFVWGFCSAEQSTVKLSSTLCDTRAETF